MPTITTTEHAVQKNGHTSFYLAAGPEDGPLIIFVHGWPELAISWRHQLPFFAAMGFRAIAPDMRGYGRSSVYPTHEAYQQSFIVDDMLALLDHLGRSTAIWVGHDWGCPVVWNLASHHPQRCRAIANLCVPYWTVERGLDQLSALVDRTRYPLDEYPAGQWEYMRFYEDHFDAATAPMDANPLATAKLLFRQGSTAAIGERSPTALVYQNQGWFDGAAQPPDSPRDADILSLEDLHAYASALTRNGFFGPNSWYMNHAANALYADQALNGGRLEMPVLFIAARYDSTCDAVHSALAEPMRGLCTHLTEAVIDSGHWMAQEKPMEVNYHLVRWLMQAVI